MVSQQALKEGAEAFIQHLKERARDWDVPIDATQWQQHATADTVELTVVSRRKAYIFSLPATDLTDPHRGTIRQEVIGRFLTAIKDNIPMRRVRRNPHPAERHRTKGQTASPFTGGSTVDPRVRPVELLLVDDSPEDARILAECLRAVQFPYHLNIVPESEAALAFLERHAPYTAVPTPDLILLDIHPLKKSGRAVLAWLRATPSLASIPLVMWSGMLVPVHEEQRDTLPPTRDRLEPTSLEGYQRLAALIKKILSEKHPDG